MKGGETMEGFMNTRDRLQGSEEQIRKARSDREREQREGDRRQREALERQSSSASRRSLCDILNGFSRQRAPMEGGLDLISEIRKQQLFGRRTAQEHNRKHDALAKSGTFESFIARNTPMPVEAGGSRGEARLPERRAVKPRGNFEIDASDPGNEPGRFSWQDKYTPPERAKILGDSAGSLRGGHGGGTGGKVREGVDLQAAIRLALSKPVKLF
jgi:hypothetical protein